MAVMQQKLVQDYFETSAVAKAITKGEIDIEYGVPILAEMIQYVRDDVETMDENGKKELDELNKSLDAKNSTRKNMIRNTTKTEDSIDERNTKRKLLKEDFNRYKRELVIMQNICYKKGWFD